MKIPSLNPFIAPMIVCPNCSNLVEPQVVSTNNKKAVDIVYVCVNEEKDCGWRLTLSKQHILGDIALIKQDELTEIRSQKKELAAFNQNKESAIRSLVAMLPELKKLVFMMRDAQQEVAEEKTKQVEPLPPGTSEGTGEEIKPVTTGTGTGTAPVTTGQGEQVQP